MSDYQPEYIKYRLSKAHEALKDAKILAANDSWNASINRLYYACYYAVSALLLKRNIIVKTHTGQITKFNELYVKTGLVDRESGRIYANLMDWRQQGDYGDMFDFDEEKVSPVIQPVERFIDELTHLIAH